MKTLLVIICSFLFISPSLAANNNGCLPKDYIDNLNCVTKLTHKLNSLKPKGSVPLPADHANVQAVVGMFSYLLKHSAEMRESILTKASSPFAKSILTEAIYRAGLQNEAMRYAEANGQIKVYHYFKHTNLPTLERLMPETTPSDNDLLIGAYSVSGNVKYIYRILQNYDRVSSNMAKTAFRIAFVMSKFGSGLTPEGRANVMANAVCAKYQCKKNPKEFQRVMTLATGFWALRSLAKKDAALQNTLESFFESHPQLKSAFVDETRKFSNYLTSLVALAVASDNHELNQRLLGYEELETI